MQGMWILINKYLKFHLEAREITLELISLESKHPILKLDVCKVLKSLACMCVKLWCTFHLWEVVTPVWLSLFSFGCKSITLQLSEVRTSWHVGYVSVYVGRHLVKFEPEQTWNGQEWDLKSVYGDVADVFGVIFPLWQVGDVASCDTCLVHNLAVYCYGL